MMWAGTAIAGLALVAAFFIFGSNQYQKGRMECKSEQFRAEAKEARRNLSIREGARREAQSIPNSGLDRRLRELGIMRAEEH